MITALKQNKFTQALAMGASAIGVLAGSMLTASSANAAQLTWGAWTGGTLLTQGDKKVTYISSQGGFAPESSLDTVNLLDLGGGKYNFVISFLNRSTGTYTGSGSFTYKIEVTDPKKFITGVSLDSTVSSNYGTTSKYVCAGNASSCSSGTILTLTSTNGSEDPVSGFAPITPAKSLLITDNFAPNAGGAAETVKNGFQQVPEPLTILGTGVVLGALPALKKEYAKRNKKKDGDA